MPARTAAIIVRVSNIYEFLNTILSNTLAAKLVPLVSRLALFYVSRGALRV